MRAELDVNPEQAPRQAAHEDGFESPSCNLCDGAAFTVVRRSCPDRRHWTGAFDIVRCDACGLVQTRPRPAREAMARFYPPGYTSFLAGNARSRGRVAELLKSLLRLPHALRYGGALDPPVPAPGCNRLLDVGCGTGRFLSEMAASGWRVQGVEPSREAARAASRAASIDPSRITVAFAEEADFPADSFDLVTLFHVLEHLHDPRHVLARIHDWLRPAGMLLVRLPNVASAESRVFGQFWWGLDLPRHLYHFSPHTARLLLDRSGFAVERIVPERQGSCLAGSLALLGDGVRGRRRDRHPSRMLYHAALLPASLLAGLGWMPTMAITARKR